MIIQSILTCPHCKHKETHELHENVVPASFRCEKCNQSTKISMGECCIYCVFGDYPCLQAQVEGVSCCARD